MASEGQLDLASSRLATGMHAGAAEAAREAVESAARGDGDPTGVLLRAAAILAECAMCAQDAGALTEAEHWLAQARRGVLRQLDVHHLTETAHDAYAKQCLADATAMAEAACAEAERLTAYASEADAYSAIGA